MLSSSSQYAIRALAYLARLDDRPWTLARQIADDLAIPPSFLSKILQTLTSQGILESQRGRKGGFRLKRNPERLTLHEVVELFDRLGPGRLCVLGQRVCSDEAACPLHFTWKHSVNAFIHRLQTTTLGDVGRNPGLGGFPSGRDIEPPAAPAG